MIWALIPNWLKYSLAAALAAFLLLAGGYAAGTIKERQRAALAAAEATALGGVPEQCNELHRVEADKP
ncbi:hypothetical protein [Brucella intermedia]|uniref:hypothetical protein n=1 Tax=Brucella intermedia TaxID=94625 RepID=UPI0023614A81|nr:hypothetical protein [Brucella intermedia]